MILTQDERDVLLAMNAAEDGDSTLAYALKLSTVRRLAALIGLESKGLIERPAQVLS